MTRKEIVDLVNEWMDNGTISTTIKMNISTNCADRLSNKKEISYTPISRLIFIGDSENNEKYSLLKSLIDGKRIMSPLVAKAEKNLRTLYQLQKAAMNGVLSRIERDGIVLYID